MEHDLSNAHKLAYILTAIVSTIILSFLALTPQAHADEYLDLVQRYNAAITDRETTSNRIDELNAKINEKEKQLEENVIVMYKLQETDVFARVLTTDNFSAFLSSLEYLTKITDNIYRDTSALSSTRDELASTIDEKNRLIDEISSEKNEIENRIFNITADDIENCNSVSEYLELVMPAYQYYCKKYGISYPGVLALQSIYEVGAPNHITTPCFKVDNNMGGLKYSSKIPGATSGTISSEGTPYSHFDTVSAYIGAAVWNIAEGDYYKSAMSATNVTDFTYKLLRVWIGYSDSDSNHYGPNVLSDYQKYGLSAYEI